MKIIYLALLTLFTSIFAVISGFGIGTVLTPTLLLFLPYQQVLIFVGILHWANSFARFLFFKKYIDWPLALYFGIPGIIMSYLGANLVFDIPKQTLNLIFGSFFILYSFFILTFKNIKLKSSKTIALLGGIFSGFTAGFFGEQGMIRSAFLTAFDLQSNIFVGTSGVISFFADTTRIITYLSKDILILKSIYLGLTICILISFLSVWIAKYIINIIPQKYFRVIVISFLFVFGLYFIIIGLINI